MKIAGINILENFTRRWQVLLVVEVVCYTLGIGFLIFGLTTHLLYTILSTILALVISLLIIKPWRPNVKRSSSFIDRHLKSAEYSTGLFLTPYEGLTNIAKLQRIQVAEQIQNQIKKLQPPNQLMKSFSVFAILIVIGIIAYQLDAKSYLNFSNSEQSPKQNITIQAVDSTLNILSIPTITEQSVKLVYPNYINKADTVSDGMDIFALEGSIATWRINFNSDIKSVIMESMGKDYPMTYDGKDYTFEIPLSNSGFYNFKFEDLKGTFYTSDLYSIEVTKDKSPIVEIKGLDQYTSFNHYDSKIFQLNSNITDDYGIDEAYIVATVSKGTGESVKFREEKLSFGNQVKRGYKRQNLRKT
ncbi:MAG: tryptophan-rich sensory protein, partial [Flavobacteriaceae bacterium]|nr:tryptophan-rich sensory protein [Flavobacteriaceae bacterium]